MRIGAGFLRGRRLEVSEGIRPTGGRTKEALFSRWQRTLADCDFLDLFAGSGAMGLEAVSRGARHAVLIERDRRALSTTQSNSERLAPGRCTVLRATLPQLPDAVLARAPFAHVFADPPYDFDAYEELLEQVARVLSAGGEAAVEHSSRMELKVTTTGLVLTAARSYGESKLSFYEISP